MTGEQKREAINKIVAECQNNKIEGIRIDLTTAGMLKSICDNLNDEQRARYLSLPIIRMVDIGWKLVQKCGVK